MAAEERKTAVECLRKVDLTGWCLKKCQPYLIERIDPCMECNVAKCKKLRRFL